MKTINKELFKSTTLIKVVLFIFLGVAHLQVSAQCPPSLSYTTIDATDAFTNNGEITVTVDPLAVGPFDYYLLDQAGQILQGTPITSASNLFTFSNSRICLPVGKIQSSSFF